MNDLSMKFNAEPLSKSIHAFLLLTTPSKHINFSRSFSIEFDSGRSLTTVRHSAFFFVFVSPSTLLTTTLFSVVAGVLTLQFLAMCPFFPHRKQASDDVDLLPFLKECSLPLCMESKSMASVVSLDVSERKGTYTTRSFFEDVLALVFDVNCLPQKWALL